MSINPTADSQWLVSEVERVARRARRLLIGRSLAQWVIFIVPLCAVFALLDAWLRFESNAWRGTLSITLLLTAIFSFLWQLAPYFLRPLNTLSAARHIERSIPQLGDRLSTAVDLSQRPSSSNDFGSWAIASAARELAKVNLDQAVDWRPTLRSLLYACVACGVMGLALLHPTGRFAVSRLSLPFAERVWPREDVLELIAPNTIQHGHDLLVRIVDHHGSLPTDLRLIIESQGDTVETRTLTPDLNVAEPGQPSSYEWTLPRIESSLRVRATGGDDQQMPWHMVEVFSGPQIEEQQVRITPPAYARQTTAAFQGGDRFQILAGSNIELEVRFTEPLAKLKAIDLKQGMDVNDAIYLLSDDGRTGNIRFETLREEIEFRLSWTDRRELTGRTEESWHFEVREDQSPMVRWEQPDHDLSVSVSAKIELVWQVTDDLGIQSSGLESDLVPTSEISTSFQAKPTDTMPVLAWSGRSTLDLSAISGLQSGVSFTLTATAEDSAGQGGRAERRVQIVDDSVIRERVADLQRRAMQAARQSLSQQRQSLAQTEAMQGQTQEEAAANLDRAAASQAAASETLVDGPDAAKRLLDQAIKQFEQNQMESDTASRLQQWSDTFAKVAQEQMLSARGELEQIAEPLEQASSDAPKSPLSNELSQRFSKIATRQGKAIEQLDAVVSAMAQDDVARQAAFDLAELDREQSQLTERTRAAQRANRTDEKLPTRQNELSRELNEVIRSLESLDSPLAKAAVEQLEQDAVATEMLRTAADLSNQQLQSAIEKQEKIEQSLSAARESLAGRSAQPKADREKNVWKAMVEQTKVLRDGQRQVVEDLERAVQPAEVATRQHQLADQTMKLAKDVSEEAAYENALQAAAADMQTTAAGLDRGRTGSKVETPARDALQRLEAILAAAESNRKRSPKKSQNTEATQSPPSEATDQSNPLAALRLWRNLQAWLQSETERVDRLRANTNQSTSRELEQRRAQLSERQAALANEIQKALELANTEGRPQ